MSQPLTTLAGNEAFAQLCQGAIAAAMQASTRHDSEALHDLRVAVSRLRVVVSHYAATGKQQQQLLRSLKRLTSMSNAGRDNEVMLAWLDQQWSLLNEAELRGARQWRRELTRAQGKAPSMSHLQRKLPPLAARLAALAAGEEMAAHPFGRGAAAQLAREGELLLAMMQGQEAVSGLHRLRLQAKRVRYLLVPLRDELEVCREAEQALQRLQLLLGEWHDSVVCQPSLHQAVVANVLKLGRETTRALRRGKLPGTERLAPSLPGLLSLARLNHQRQKQLEVIIVRDYLEDGGSRLAAPLQRAVSQLRGQAARSEANRLT